MIIGIVNVKYKHESIDRNAPIPINIIKIKIHKNIIKNEKKCNSGRWF